MVELTGKGHAPKGGSKMSTVTTSQILRFAQNDRCGRILVMSFSVIYLIQRFFYRVGIFLYDWYVGGFLFFAKHGVNFLERLDRFWAIKITARNFFRPLYQDATFIGRILGIILRTFRIGLALILYVLIISALILFYLIWALIPILIIGYGAGILF